MRANFHDLTKALPDHKLEKLNEFLSKTPKLEPVCVYNSFKRSSDGQIASEFYEKFLARHQQQQQQQQL